MDESAGDEHFQESLRGQFVGNLNLLLLCWSHIADSYVSGSAPESHLQCVVSPRHVFSRCGLIRHPSC